MGKNDGCYDLRSVVVDNKQKCHDVAANARIVEEEDLFSARRNGRMRHPLLAVNWRKTGEE